MHRIAGLAFALMVLMATPPRNRAGRPEYESLESAATRLSVSSRTLRRQAAAGKLKVYRVGGQLRVRTDDTDKLATPLRPEQVAS